MEYLNIVQSHDKEKIFKCILEFGLNQLLWKKANPEKETKF